LVLESTQTRVNVKSSDSRVSVDLCQVGIDIIEKKEYINKKCVTIKKP